MTGGPCPPYSAAGGGGQCPPYGLSDSMRLVQEGLAAMQALQQQTAAAHQRFLETQAAAHRTFQEIIEGQHRLVARSMGMDAPAGPMAPAMQPAPSRRAGAGETPVPPSYVNTVSPVQGVAREAPRQAAPAEAEKAAAEASPVAGQASPAAITDALVEEAPIDSGPGRAGITDIVMAVVCEKTGYPREMIELEMDIEADLGVDSIKRVEIIAGIEERLPDFGGVKPEQMGGIRTLSEIVGFIEAALPGDGSVHDAGFNPPAGRACHRESGAGSEDGFAATLLGVVSDLTGYPRETLDLGMDIEADLGIDSIKRVEILAAVEAKAPELPAVQPEQMGAMRTLQQIVDHFSASAVVQVVDARGSGTREDPGVTAGALIKKEADGGSAAGALSEKEKDSGGEAAAECDEEEESDVDIERRVLTLVDLPAARAGTLRIADGHEVLVTDDGSGLSQEIARRLAAAGVAARVVALGLEVERDAGRPVGGLIVVSPAGGADDVPSAAGEATLKQAFALLHDVTADLEAAGARGGGVFAAVSRMDGAFGLSGRGYDPAQGGLAGLVKTAAQEWPGVRCKSLDVAASWAETEAIASVVVQELSAEGPVEVAHPSRGSRRGLELVPVDEGDTAVKNPWDGRARRAYHPVPLDDGDVVVISGGARGVTAEAAVALAGAVKATLVLLGRSSPPGPEPAWLAGLDDPGAIRQAVLAHEFAGRSTPTPVALRAAVDRYLAQREVARTLARIEAAGGRAEYRSVDVRDMAAVRAVLDEVQAAHGPVRGIVHAAGVLEDRRIADKTAAQFNAVFDTKIHGLRSLLAGVRAAELKAIVFFSSVSARFGNAGQADYAVANEVLNKTAQRLVHRLPNCAVVSINWGPWDGGMVTPALKARFRERGVGLIPLRAGGRRLLSELASASPDAAEVVLGAGLVETASDATMRGGGAPTAARGAQMDVAFRRRLDLERHGFLRDHVLDGRPVLPVAMMIEWMAHAALHGNPGLVFHGLEDLWVLKGVVLREDAPEVVLAVGRPRANGQLLDVDVELRSVAGGKKEAPGIAGGALIRNEEGASNSAGTAIGGVGETVHARATVVLASRLPEGAGSFDMSGLAAEAYARGVAGAYDEVLFHGESFKAIERVDGHGSDGIVVRARIGAPPERWMRDPLRSNWVADPLLMDAAFQAAILWCFEHTGMVSLPSFVGRYRQYVRTMPASGAVVALRVRERTPHQMKGDIAFLDEGGRVLARLEGYVCTIDAALRAAFRRNAGIGTAS